MKTMPTLAGRFIAATTGVILLFVFATAGADDLITLWGPEEFHEAPCTLSPEDCEGQIFEASLRTLGIQPPFTLYVVNGDGAGNHKASAARVWVDGVQIFGPRDFRPQTDTLSAEVPLRDTANLTVSLGGGSNADADEGDSLAQLIIYIRGFAPGTLRIANPAGNRLEYASGVILTLPAGAVPDYTPIEVYEIQCDAMEQTVLDSTISSGLQRCLGGFRAEPDGLVFDLPIEAQFPVEAPELGGFPILLQVDTEQSEFSYRPTDLTYDDAAGVISGTVHHFSNIVTYLFKEAAVACLNDPECVEFNKLREACSKCENWSPTLCGAVVPLEKQSCCSMYPSEREACGFVGNSSCECCTEKTIHVQSDFTALGSDSCEIAGDNVEVTFRACEGTPTQTARVKDMSEHCPEMDVQLTIDPDGAEMLVDETVQFSASIIGTTKKGELVPFPADTVAWFTQDPTVATVESTGGIFGHTGESATVKGVGGGTTNVVAIESGTRLRDDASVYVEEEEEEETKFNIAFVVNNGIWTLDHFPPFGSSYLYTNWTDGWYVRSKGVFGDNNFSVAMVNYNRNSNPNGLDYCGYDSAGLDGYTLRVDLTDSQSAWNDAWKTLSSVCDNANPDMGNQLYSGVLHAIDTVRWEANAFKAIVVLPKKTACYVIGEGLCYREPYTGLQLSDITQAAIDAGIQLFVINSYNTHILPECGGAGCTLDQLYCYQAIAARDMHKKLALDTGGKYYNSWTCDYSDPNVAVLQALQDIFDAAQPPQP